MSHEAYFIAAQCGVSPIAYGMPGCAKTATIGAFAKAAGRQCYTLIGSIRDASDVGGFPFPGTRDGKDFIRLTPPEWAVNCCDGNKWIIFLDELTTVVPAVQAAMLRILSERVVGDLTIPADTWIIAAANPSGVAANGCDLEPPMANRLCHLKWEMDWDAWESGLLNGLAFPAPSFPILPANWRDSLGEVAGLIAAFRRCKPTLFADYPENDRSKASGAWPSPRSWTNAALCLAAAVSVDAEDHVQHELLEGCVGKGAAIEFSSWRRQLDLPEPEKVVEWALAALTKKPKYWPTEEALAEKLTAYQHPNRPDKAIALLNGVTYCVLNKLTPERWQAGVHVMSGAAKFQEDVVLACARPLCRALKERSTELGGLKLSDEFVNTLFPMIKRALID